MSTVHNIHLYQNFPTALVSDVWNTKSCPGLGHSFLCVFLTNKCNFETTPNLSTHMCHEVITRDFRLSPKFKWGLRCCGESCRLNWQLVIYRRFGISYRSNLEGSSIFSDCSTLKNGTDWLNRNVRYLLRNYQSTLHGISGAPRTREAFTVLVEMVY